MPSSRHAFPSAEPPSIPLRHYRRHYRRADAPSSRHAAAASHDRLHGLATRYRQSRFPIPAPAVYHISGRHSACHTTLRHHRRLLYVISYLYRSHFHRHVISPHCSSRISSFHRHHFDINIVRHYHIFLPQHESSFCHATPLASSVDTDVATLAQHK
jgi:hypothetical protein